ncbi:putative histone-lysine N-methyltransferase [Trypanosoma vivax]|uniref:Histone-lysine N-methyltransferase, H3 lysine-79 specific n=1 Tax=Trypanosoma vivax (strain Y486) TaxID=1055687 RepID=G0TQZ3_TRYVY|nr:putative histone-lysine N-methyltransferase [Trypanosoma vivax]CCC46356.1 putative histone-lysine N-methyltransferase [Trypanosoma vivax Y486]
MNVSFDTVRMSLPIKRSRSSKDVFVSECGSGLPSDPFFLPVRKSPNSDSCYHCSDQFCLCIWVKQQLESCYASLSISRQTLCPRRRELCSKSVLPPFVARMSRIANITLNDTFYDLGCGNGSVLFHVALLTGARCIGVEINERNAQVAREAWRVLRPVFEARCGKSLDVRIISGDFCVLLKDESFFDQSSVIWAANLLLPPSVNHFLSERFRLLEPGCRVLCMEDLYPHSRAIAAIRDPDAFAKFDIKDYRWQAGSVEWSNQEGPLYLYTRRP